MTAIWQKGDQGWAVLEPVGFEDEAARTAYVEDRQLAGQPKVAAAGQPTEGPPST